MLQQCDNVKLQKKIIAEDLKYEDIIKYGVALEQGEKKVRRFNEDSTGKSKNQESVNAVDAYNSCRRKSRL